jgi:hypothetical protein
VTVVGIRLCRQIVITDSEISEDIETSRTVSTWVRTHSPGWAEVAEGLISKVISRSLITDVRNTEISAE